MTRQPPGRRGGRPCRSSTTSGSRAASGFALGSNGPARQGWPAERSGNNTAGEPGTHQRRGVISASDRREVNLRRQAAAGDWDDQPPAKPGRRSWSSLAGTRAGHPSRQGVARSRQRCRASAFTAPHVTEFLQIDVTETMAATARLACADSERCWPIRLRMRSGPRRGGPALLQVRAQNAASGSSITSVVVVSAISRSAASLGSTVWAKNRAAAILPW